MTAMPSARDDRIHAAIRAFVLCGVAPSVRLIVQAAKVSSRDAQRILRERRVTIEAMGRRGASRPRRSQLLLPDADGALAIVEPMGALTPINVRAR